MFSQPFAPINDQNYYSLMPGESADSFTGAGWTLSGGASIVTATLADGAPARSSTSQRRHRRQPRHLRDLAVSGRADRGPRPRRRRGRLLQRRVPRHQHREQPKNTGQVHSNKGAAWDASDPVNIQPSGGSGWQQMRIVLVGKGNHSDFQVYNLYIDPRLA